MKTLLAILLATACSACVLVTDPPPGSKSGSQGSSKADSDVVLCHKGKKTMSLPREAAAGHIGHGDHYGAC